MEHSKIFILRCEKCNRVLDFLTKNSFENESGKVYTCTCGHKTGVRNPKLLTDIEYTERERLLELQRNHQRWFTQQEFDRLTELNNKMFRNGGSPQCG